MDILTIAILTGPLFSFFFFKILRDLCSFFWFDVSIQLQLTSFDTTLAAQLRMKLSFFSLFPKFIMEGVCVCVCVCVCARAHVHNLQEGT